MEIEKFKEHMQKFNDKDFALQTLSLFTGFEEFSHYAEDLLPGATNEELEVMWNRFAELASQPD